jgi:hypothetical protein
MLRSSREGVKVKTGAAVAVVETVAMVVADNNRDGGGRQQSTKCGSGSGSGRDTGRGNSNFGSVTAMVAVSLADDS